MRRKIIKKDKKRIIRSQGGKIRNSASRKKESYNSGCCRRVFFRQSASGYLPFAVAHSIQSLATLVTAAHEAAVGHGSRSHFRRKHSASAVYEKMSGTCKNAGFARQNTGKGNGQGEAGRSIEPNLHKFGRLGTL